MGLTDFRPVCRIRVNGGDVTDLFLQRNAALSLTDVAGIESDTCEIVLTDHIPLLPIDIPPAGAEIEIALGYLAAASVMGVYIADEVEVSGPPGQMRITGYAAAFGASDGGKNPLTEAKTRSWPEGTTVGAMVAKIADESGFRPAATEKAAAVALPHIDQIDESDANLLTRVAREFGLRFKPGGGALVVYMPGESVSATGEALPRVALGPRDVTRWSMRIARREASATVVAQYRDFGQTEPKEVRIEGKAEGVDGVAQVTRLRRIYPTEAAAKAAAEAEAKRGARAVKTLSVQLPGRADLMAEGRAVLSGFRPGVDGEWLVTTVTHSMGSGGWSSSFEAELPGDQ